MTDNGSPHPTSLQSRAPSPFQPDMSAQVTMAESSPIHPAHLATPFQTTPMSHQNPNTTPSQLASASSSYADSLSNSRDDLMDGTHVTPTKGKNGATGPAEGKMKPHICQICQRGFTTGGHLQRHQRIHTGVKAFKCPYPGCETRTSRQDNLQQHYRTHLSPTLRRGSGSAARAAVNAAMEAAGLKSTSSRAPRKSKGSGGGTPSSATSASASHMPSPYQTPTSQGPTSYAPPYLYDPNHGAYPAYPAMAHPGVMAQAQSANSSRVPSPVNGHSSSHSSVGSMPSAHHQPYFNQFSPAYYPAMQAQYRYGPGVPSPYNTAPHPHHGLYSPGLVADHGGHGYSPIQTGFPTHSREGSYGGMMTPAYGANPMANGYPPPRTQNSTPLNQVHDNDDRYRRPLSPRRRSPGDISQGVVDPSHMTTNRPGGMAPNYAAYTHNMGGYGGYVPPNVGNGNGNGNGNGGQAQDLGHRASSSSLSDGSGKGGSDGQKLHQ